MSMQFSPLNLSAVSVRRKIAVSCFIIMLILLGAGSYHRIGIDILPKFDVPYVQVTAVYPGASPEEVETEIARRIEDAVGSLDGLKHTTTICMENAAAITLEFELGTNVDLMLHDVREKLNRIADDLPSGAEMPRLSKLNVNTVPVATVFLCGERTLDELYDYADDTLSDAFASIPGVGEVRLHGGNEVQLHILPRRKKLAECGITVPELAALLKHNHLKLPIGRLKRQNSEITLTYDAEFKSVADLKSMEITRIGGRRILLGDLAEVELKSKERRQLAYYNGKPGISLDIVKKADANSVKVIGLVRKRFEELRSEPGRLPGGMELIWFKDTGDFIQSAVNDAWLSVFIGILLTALVLYLFLHRLRPTLIITVTLPVSFVISFLLIRVCGYTFDMMTLVALGCACGVLVDNSVVVLESVFRKMTAGEAPETAVVTGTSSVANAVLASSLTNIVVFLPIAMMTSVAGLLVGPFAAVMVLVTLISIFVTFTLTPILGSMLLSDPSKQQDGALARLWDRGYEWTRDRFIASLGGVRKHALLVTAAILILCGALLVWCVPQLNFTFVPSNDRGEMTLNLEFPADSSLEANAERVKTIMSELRTLPYVESVGATVGYRNATTGQLAEGVYLAGIVIKLIPRSKRAAVSELLEDVRKRIAKYDNLQFNLAIPVISGSSGADLTAYVAGPDPAELDRYALLGEEILRKSGKAEDLDTTVRPGKPRIFLLPNRPVLRNLGIHADAVGLEALGFFDGIEAGTWKVGARSYDIRIKTDDERGVESLSGLIAGSRNGRPLNMEVFTQQRPEPVMLCIRRQDKQRCAWIYANPARGESLSSLVDLLRKELAPQLPAGYRLEMFGQAEMLDDGVADFKTAFLVATLLTYLL
ncbi:MAG: efflux RND transporter permease subunit, partial [Lentisphaeria bacterium]|nr:efflux RND transporter permease subunit [Lentisphaeria bacterium]